MRRFALFLLVSFTVLGQSPLARTYREGEVLIYRMKAISEEDGVVHRYEATSTHTVRMGGDGLMEEVIAWSDLVQEGKPTALSEASQSFRQILSRAPGRFLAPPDLKGTRNLDGPALDLLTFYADLFVASLGAAKPGDHFRLPCPQANRFAFGPEVVIAEQAIDFDVTLVSIDREKGIVNTVVKHVPPKEARVKLPAPWMRGQEGIEPYNWVQVVHAKDGTFTAEAGRETFTVELQTDLRDGRLLKARMDNPVDVLAHRCPDAKLEPSGPGRRYRIHRHVDLDLVSAGTPTVQPEHKGSAPRRD